jgi:CIC family chloride channel protein
MAAVMIFELSGDYAIVLPLLVATGIATILSRWLRPDSIYGEELRRHGTTWDMTIDGRRLHRVPASDHGAKRELNPQTTFGRAGPDPKQHD